MRLLSVNVGQVQPLLCNGRAVPSAIVKQPVQGRVHVTRLRLEGDCQANLQVHGGLNKAVYAYPVEHYPTWAAELGRELAPYGTYGENLTLSGLLETTVSIGDRLRISDTLLEVSEPREPCFKLEARLQWPGFARLMIASRRCGFYLRVLEEGSVGAGDAVEIVWRDPAAVQVAELFPLLVSREAADPRVARRALAIASLSPRLRGRMQRIASGEELDDE